jgi:hypothetical protein
MVNQNHPITPPPELVLEWQRETNHNEAMFPQVAAFAAQWGADQELEACCEWFQEFYKTESWVKHDLKHLRVARRPKPPSLKEQALEALKLVQRQTTNPYIIEPIRRALEALDD